MRYHNVYGPGMPRDTPYAGVAAIFTSALRRGEAPKVFEDGGQRRDFVHVRDVAAATVLACETHVAGVRAFNVGSGTPRTVGDMARALAKALNGPEPVVTGHYRLGDVRHITADSSRLRDELGWVPRIDFADGMAELAQLLHIASKASRAGSRPSCSGSQFRPDVVNKRCLADFGVVMPHNVWFPNCSNGQVNVLNPRASR